MVVEPAVFVDGNVMPDVSLMTWHLFAYRILQRLARGLRAASG